LRNVRSGNPIEIAGDDGMLYRYRVDEAVTVSESEVIQTFGNEDASVRRLSIFVPTDPFDYAQNRYLNFMLVRAGRTDDPPEPIESSDESQTGDLECAASVLPELAANPWEAPQATGAPPAELPPNPEGFATLDELRGTLADAEPIRRAFAREIEASLGEALACDLAVREALVLPDDRVLALLGPPGVLPLEAVSGDADISTVQEVPGQDLFGFFVLTRDGETWLTERFYGIY
jgi:hypothetical protein